MANTGEPIMSKSKSQIMKEHAQERCFQVIDEHVSFPDSIEAFPSQEDMRNDLRTLFNDSKSPE
jgi:hypothetical protein